jgi:Trm5-related predicted tRNA methylase
MADIIDRLEMWKSIDFETRPVMEDAILTIETLRDEVNRLRNEISQLKQDVSNNVSE